MADVVLLTEDRYENPIAANAYIENILLEARLLQTELEKLGLDVTRKSWSNPNFDWNKANAAIFRTTWDYFDRFEEFHKWLNQVNDQLMLINSLEIINWNLDKHYLQDLQNEGINITPTYYAEKGSKVSLSDIQGIINAPEMILKPTVSGAARHTYRLNRENIQKHEELFQSLLEQESMMIQPLMKNILSFGEISLMLFDGKYSHAIIKKAKEGDFRVQDDFGGSVDPHQATIEEIKFAEDVFKACKYKPVYGRVDMTYDNSDQLCVMELELIEPELWFRFNENSASLMAKAIVNNMNKDIHLSL